MRVGLLILRIQSKYQRNNGKECWEKRSKIYSIQVRPLILYEWSDTGRRNDFESNRCGLMHMKLKIELEDLMLDADGPWTSGVWTEAGDRFQPIPRASGLTP